MQIRKIKRYKYKKVRRDKEERKDESNRDKGRETARNLSTLTFISRTATMGKAVSH